MTIESACICEYKARRPMKGEPYTTDLCRECWVKLNSQSLSRISTVPRGPCQHLGEKLRNGQVAAQGLNPQSDWFPCNKGHGIVRPCGRCQSCHEHQPISPDTETALSAGIVIGTYGWPALCRVHILTIRETCGDVPILIADDGSPSTGDLARLAEEFGVSFAGSLTRKGHYAGDLSVFRKGLEWAKERSFDVLVKLSVRCILLRPRWLQDMLALFGNAPTVVPRQTEGTDKVLYIRTEAIAMRVAIWYNSLGRLGDDRLGNPTELRLWDIIQNNHGGRFVNWPLLPPDRFVHSPDMLNHCADAPQAYYAHAARYGLTLDSDFYTVGHDRKPGWVRG